MTISSRSVGAVASGAICLAILSGMLVVHAWPLWTGQSVTLPVTPVDPRDFFRGEYVRLDTPATRLTVGTGVPPSAGTVAVRPIGPFWVTLAEYVKRPADFEGRIVYVQLEPGPSGVHHPVSISTEPVTGALNLRGRLGWSSVPTERINVDYGLDSYFMQEGSAKRVEDAVRTQGRVQMEIAIAASGHARIRRLLIDGVPVGP